MQLSRKDRAAAFAALTPLGELLAKRREALKGFNTHLYIVFQSLAQGLAFAGFLFVTDAQFTYRPC